MWLMLILLCIYRISKITVFDNLLFLNTFAQLSLGTTRFIKLSGPANPVCAKIAHTVI